MYLEHMHVLKYLFQKDLAAATSIIQEITFNSIKHIQIQLQLQLNIFKYKLNSIQ